MGLAASPPLSQAYGPQSTASAAVFLRTRRSSRTRCGVMSRAAVLGIAWGSSTCVHLKGSLEIAVVRHIPCLAVHLVTRQAHKLLQHGQAGRKAMYAGGQSCPHTRQPRRPAPSITEHEPCRLKHDTPVSQPYRKTRFLPAVLRQLLKHRCNSLGIHNIHLLWPPTKRIAMPTCVRVEQLMIRFVSQCISMTD